MAHVHPSLLVVGLNSYGSLDEADAYLGASARAGVRWPALAQDVRERCLISAWRVLDRQRWQGTKVPNLLVVSSFGLSAGGASWAADDHATVDGTAHRLARLAVLTVSAGAIATARLEDAGLYTATPAGAISPVAPGAGTGASLSLSMLANPCAFPRSGLLLCGSDEPAIETGFPDPLKAAQFELAYDISLSVAAETAGGVGSNLKRAKADTVEVEFFRPTGGVNGDGSARFPSYILELIGCWLDGAGALDPSFYGAVSGMGATSTVADPQEFGLTIP